MRKPCIVISLPISWFCVPQTPSIRSALLRNGSSAWRYQLPVDWQHQKACNRSAMLPDGCRPVMGADRGLPQTCSLACDLLCVI